MNISTLVQFESKLERESPLDKLWCEVKPYINSGKVESRGQAYVLFSQALKISKLTKQDQVLNELWKNLLNQACFSLCIEGDASITYNFDTINQLLSTGKDSFEIEVVEIDPKSANLLKVAEGIDVIALSSLGNSPGASRFQSIIARPTTLCILALHQKDTPVACVYGSYLELPKVKFFHFNFLGRKIEYPSVHIVEILQNEAHRIRDRFPHVQYLTLCVDASNNHMLTSYQELGFNEIEYMEAGPHNGASFFLGKKLDDKLQVEPPTYLEYKDALEAQRKK